MFLLIKHIFHKLHNTCVPNYERRASVVKSHVLSESVKVKRNCQTTFMKFSTQRSLFFKDLCGAFKICLVAFLNSFPVLIFCSFPMHLLFSKICFLVLFMMNHYLQDFLSMNSSMLTNTFSKLAHSIACIISNKRLAYFLVTFFLASVCISGLKESRVMLTHCTVVAVSQILQCPVNWYFCSGVTITASSRK